MGYLPENGESGRESARESRMLLRPAIVTERRLLKDELVNACTIDWRSPVFEETERRALVHESVVANAAHVWCEFDDGHMEEVPIGAVRYMDSGEVFADFVWDGDGLEPEVVT